MPTVISGAIQNVVKKPTQRGNLGTFITVNGQLYGGFKPTPELKAGDVVSFSAEQNQKGFWNFDNLQILSEASSRPVPVPSPVPSGATGAPGPMADDREKRITRLNATGSAIAMVNGWLTTQPKNNTDLDTLFSHVKHYAQKIYNINFYGYDFKEPVSEEDEEVTEPMPY